MDRRSMKELTRMGKKMDYGQNGIIMEKRRKKAFTRMGKKWLTFGAAIVMRRELNSGHKKLSP